MKKLLIFLFLIILSSNAYSDSKFEKELKKVSKDNGFVDSNGETYPSEQITDKKNTILIIYNHGSDNDQKTDKCTNPGNNVAKVIGDLHNKKIKNFNVKIYRFCTGAKGWSEKEQTKMWKAHEKTGKLSIELKDKDFMKIAREAHKRDITINKMINIILKDGIKNAHYRNLGSEPQLLNETE